MAGLAYGSKGERLSVNLHVQGLCPSLRPPVRSQLTAAWCCQQPVSWDAPPEHFLSSDQRRLLTEPVRHP